MIFTSRSLQVVLLTAVTTWQGASAQELNLERLLTIGVLDGPKCETLGRIGSGVIGADGHLLIVDELARAVRVFDEDGSCLPSIGRAGQGPGEFQEPRRARLTTDTLFLMDIANLRLERFQLGDQGAVRLDEIPLSLVPEDFCMMNNEIFILAYDAGHAIHVFDANGNPIRSFASVANQDHPQLASIEASGYLHCDADQNLVVHAQFYRPIVKGYAPDGSMRWTSVIPDYAQTVITPLPNGGVRFADAEPGRQSDVTVALASLDREHLIIQTGKIAGLRVFDSLRAVTVGKTTGNARVIDTDLPAILDLRAALLLTMSADEFPYVSLWRYQVR